MSDTVISRMLSIPAPLYQKLTSYTMKKYGDKPESRTVLNYVMKLLKYLPDRHIYIADMKTYLRFITDIFSLDVEKVPFNFREDEWRLINTMRLEYRIATSNCIRLLFAALMYQDADISIPLKDIFSHLLSDTNDYQYSVTMTGETARLVSDLRKKLNISFDNFFRASHFFYASPVPSRLVISENHPVSVHNMSLSSAPVPGIKKTTMRGSLSMKNFLFQKRDVTKKSIGLIINNVLYSFCNDSREMTT
jgi:hypothetical protein